MNSYSKTIEDNLTCPICFEFMRTPTTAICGHNFCYECLQRSLFECAVCRRKLNNNEITVNYQLKEIIPAFREIKLQFNRQQEQTQVPVKPLVVPIFVQTANLFNKPKMIRPLIAEYSTGDPLKLKNRGSHTRKTFSKWEEEASPITDSHTSYLCKLDVEMDASERVNISGRENGPTYCANSEMIDFSRYSYLNGKRFKYK